ncbi:MAG: hypothetical protein AAFZ63_25385 [Bacteroidota bacterium]
MVRGGSWNNNNPDNCRVANRNRNNTNNRNNNIGFRLSRYCHSLQAVARVRRTKNAPLKCAQRLVRALSSQ